MILEKSKRVLLTFLVGIFFYILIVVLFGIVFYYTKSISYNLSSYKLSFYDSFYFSVVSFLTIGFGDIAPINDTGKAILIVESVFSIGFNAIFAAYLAFELLKRPKDLIISDNIYIRKVKSNSINEEQNYRLTIRIGNKGIGLLDCKGYLEFFKIIDNTRNTLQVQTREYRLLEKSWNFNILLNENSNNFLVNYLFEPSENKYMRFSITGIDNETGQTISATKVYTLNNLKLVTSFDFIYQWENGQRVNFSWKNFTKYTEMSEEEILNFNRFLDNRRAN